MAIKPYMTSDTLVEAVKRKMAIPTYQNTFTAEDILALANEEVFLSQVPSIMQYHEEYFVHTQTVALTASTSSYPIPNRAIGMKLRDLFFQDSSGNLIEMSKINPDEKSFFSEGTDSSNTPIYYYLQNNKAIIVPEVSATPTGSLVFSYFLRPNSLVPNEGAIIAATFIKTITVVNASVVAGDTITIEDLVLTAGTDFAIGASSSATAANIVTAISTDGTYTASSLSAVVSVVYTVRADAFSTSRAAAFVISPNITITSTQTIPTDIVAGDLVDFLQTDGGHSTLSFDVTIGAGNIATTGITFDEDDIPDDFVKGDYICAQYECIVPQVPTDLHNLLAERTCARILEAQGDDAGLKNANMKIIDLEARQAVLIDSRVDGSPMKVFNKNSLLRSGKNNSRRG